MSLIFPFLGIVASVLFAAPINPVRSDNREGAEVRAIVSETDPGPTRIGGLGTRMGEWSPSSTAYFLVTREEDGRERWVRTAYAAAPSEPWRPTTGNYKLVVVPLTIQPQGGSAPPLTITESLIRNTLFDATNSVARFYSEASYGMLRFSGIEHSQADVVPVTIAATITANCQNQIAGEFTQTVRQRLLEQNIDTFNGSVDIGLVVYNDIPGCPPYPFATRGALGARGVPVWVWMPESWFLTGPAIVAHEMGHAFGGNHPAAMRCGDFNKPSTCTIEDAADRHLMAFGGQYFMMPSAFDRRRWGWHPHGAFAAQRPRPLMFDLRPTSDIFAKESLRSGRFYLANMGGAWAGWDLYAETRRQFGTFENYAATDEGYRRGAALRIAYTDYADPNAVLILLDPNATEPLGDAPLRAGQQLSIGGMSVQVTRETAAVGARLRVE